MLLLLLKNSLVSIIVTPYSDYPDATRMNMDFLSLGDARTNPIINPVFLSDKVRMIYGANLIRNETAHEDLRNANGNSGNVVENKSLYCIRKFMRSNQAQ